MDLHLLSTADWAWLQRILSAIASEVTTWRPPTKLEWAVPQPINKQTGAPMPGTVTVANDQDLRIGLKWSDSVGVIGHPPLTGTTVTSSDTNVISGGDVASDDESVVLRVVGDGTCDVTVSNGPLSDTITVVVAEPTPTQLQLDVSDVTAVTKGTPA